MLTPRRESKRSTVSTDEQIGGRRQQTHVKEVRRGVREEKRSGRLYFGSEWALYLGPGLPATVHAHQAVQVCIPLQGRLRLRTDQDGRWRAYKGALIPSNLAHESDRAVPLLASIWLEASAPSVRALAKSVAGRISEIEGAKLVEIVPQLRECWNDRWNARHTHALVSCIIRTLAPNAGSPQPLDPRVLRAIKILGGTLDHRLSVGDVAQVKGVSVSKSRLMHLFEVEMGTPVRRYVLWLRLRDAIQRLGAGSSMTEAAIGAGFSDAPHFDRTFKRMLGFTPSSALRLRVSTFVQDTSVTAD